MGVTEASMNRGREDTSQVRLSHDLLKTHASFDDPNLVSRAGLVPVMALAERCGLAGLVREHVTIASRTWGYWIEGAVPGRGDGRRGEQHR